MNDPAPVNATVAAPSSVVHATHTTLTASKTQVTGANVPVTLIATVGESMSHDIPAGRVAFFLTAGGAINYSEQAGSPTERIVQGQIIGVADLQPDGTATLTIDQLARGTSTFVAVYLGKTPSVKRVRSGAPAVWSGAGFAISTARKLVLRYARSDIPNSTVIGLPSSISEPRERIDYGVPLDATVLEPGNPQLESSTSGAVRITRQSVADLEVRLLNDINGARVADIAVGVVGVDGVATPVNYPTPTQPTRIATAKAVLDLNPLADPIVLPGTSAGHGSVSFVGGSYGAIGSVTTFGDRISVSNGGGFLLAPTLPEIVYLPSTPPGLIALYINGQRKDLAVENGVARWRGTMGPLKSGRYTLHAHANDARYTETPSMPLEFEVAAAATSTVLNVERKPTRTGETARLTATVSTLDAADFGVRGGTVTFKAGDRVLATSTFTDGALPTPVEVKLPPGTYSITAEYSGDDYWAPSQTAAPEALVVRGPQLKLQKWGKGSAGSPPIFTATVVRPDGTLFAGTKWPKVNLPETTAPLSSASVTLKDKRKGTKGGTPLYPTTSSILTSVANGTDLFRTNSPDRVTVGNTSATVQSPYGKVPTGLVGFYDGDKLLGTAALSADGTATFRPQSMKLGNRSITAIYQGDGVFAPATSAALPVTIAKAQTEANIQMPDTAMWPGATLNVTLSAYALDSTGPAPTGKMRLILQSPNGDTRRLKTIRLGSGNPQITLKLAPGAYTLSAVYEGDDRHEASAERKVMFHVVSPVAVKNPPRGNGQQ